MLKGPPPLPDEPLPDIDQSTFVPPLPDEPLPDSVPKSTAPPLPDEPIPDDPPLAQTSAPLPDELVPAGTADSTQLDDWEAYLDQNSQAFYFYNKRTKETTWDNPRASADDGTPKESNEIAFRALFDKKTGKFVANPEYTMEQNTSDAREDRILSRYFDPATNDAGGKSLRAERAAIKYSKEEMRKIKKKYKEQKDARKREWLINDDIEDERRRRQRYR